MPAASARLAAPGSLLWLVLHEVRLAFRGRRTGIGKWIRLVLLVGYFLLGLYVAYQLRGMPLTPKPRWLITGNAALLVMLTFMTTQSLMNALRTLFEKTDLDLLLSSPLPEGRVLAAKMLGIAASAGATYCLLLLPLALPVAFVGHPRLLAVVPVAAALAMLSATFGLTFAMLLVRFIGARGARSVGQIVAAGTAGAIYLFSQLSGHNRPGSGRIAFTAGWLRAHGWGLNGLTSLPARGLFGEIGPLLLLVGVSGLLFALTSWLFRTRFLASVQSAGDRSSR
jgi:ABC-2 type transport system permease protein